MGPGFLLLRLAEKTWMQPYVPGPEELHGVMAACMTEPPAQKMFLPAPAARWVDMVSLARSLYAD